MIRMRHILVVCDDSPDGDHALFTAAGLAQQIGAQLTVAAVAEVDTRHQRRCCGSGASYLAKTEREDATTRLRRAALLLTDYEDVEFITTYGNRPQALVSAAAEHNCDLLVVPAAPRRHLPWPRTLDPIRALRRRATIPILQTPSAAAGSLVRRQHSEPPATS